MIFRIDVRPVCADPQGQSLQDQIRQIGIDAGQIKSSRIFLIDSDASLSEMQQAARELLADPIVESAEVEPAQARTGSLIEIHLKPGVMDPVAASTEMALRDMNIGARQVRTGRSYQFEKQLAADQLRQIAQRFLANGVIESVHFQPFHPAEF